MPVYNQEAFVGKAIQSVLGQSYRNWFLSICDDGSTDASPSIAALYAGREARRGETRESSEDAAREARPRIAAVRHPHNLGLSAARNTAYAAIPHDAEFVMFLDSDDLLEPDALEQQRRLITTPARRICRRCRCQRTTMGSGETYALAAVAVPTRH